MYSVLKAQIFVWPWSALCVISEEKYDKYFRYYNDNQNKDLICEVQIIHYGLATLLLLAYIQHDGSEYFKLEYIQARLSCLY